MPVRICPECGGELPPGLPEGTCPTCLLKLGLGAIPPAAVRSEVGSGGSEQAGSLIGRYKLLEPIGEGGFGTVWLAEQQEPVRRKVALKIIKLGMDTREVVARFEAERQALALMDHPNIARVFDGGATESGRPYFVMELVKGVRITDYCDARQLGTEERLKLFMEVCQAVQHAHQKGVIHRDLKPSNVLVTEQDGHAVPKVIDFGIAKATAPELTEKTFFTRFNQLVGTPAYMSPEQAGLGSLDVDTRSDVYSLGVLLYELLTGRTPFSNEELLKAGLDQVLRIIREKDPPKPSTQLSTLSQADLLAVALRRASEPARLNRRVKGELDWIVMKCLEKDRARRYETANGLVRDIERHLNNEPVVAAAPSVTYQLGKFASRHRVGLATAMAFVFLLLVGVIVSLSQAIRARHAEADARAKKEIAEQARRQSEEDLWKARLAEARALRFGGELGRKGKGLDAIAQAARVRSTPELLDEAISTLALFDLQSGTNWVSPPRARLCLDHVFQRFATHSDDGHLVLWRLGDQARLAEWDLPDPMDPMCFSLDDRYLWAPKAVHGRPDVILDLAKSEPLRELPGTPFLAFSPDSRRYATVESDGAEVVIHDLASGAAILRFNPADGQRFAQPGASHPTENLLAVTESNAVSVWDWNTGKRRGTYEFDSKILRVACDGPWLAAGGFRTVRIWNRDTHQMQDIAAHAGRVAVVAFLAGGEFLASEGVDGNTRLWHPVYATPLLTTQSAYLLGLDPAGRRLGFSYSTGFGWWEMRRPVGRRELGPPFGGSWSTFSPDGTLLATWLWGWLAVYDAESGKLLSGPGSGRGQFADLTLVQFLPDNLTLLTSDGNGVLLWNFKQTTNAGARTLQWGTQRRVEMPVPPPYQYRWQPEAVADGTRVAIRPQEDTVLLVSLNSPKEAIRFAGSRPDSFSLSPDGRWVATGDFFGNGPCVWEAATGQVVRAFETDNSHAWFSRDGRTLLIGGSQYYRFLEVGTWRELHRIATASGADTASRAAWSVDGRLLAITQRHRQVRLLDGRTWQPLANLTSPNDFEISDLRFSPDGQRLVVCRPAGPIEIWDLPELGEALTKFGLSLPLPK